MPAFLRAIGSRAAPVLRGRSVMQTANLYTRPAKEKIGTVVSTVPEANAMLTVSICP